MSMHSPLFEELGKNFWFWHLKRAAPWAVRLDFANICKHANIEGAVTKHNYLKNIRTKRGITCFLSVEAFKSVQENHIHIKNQKFLRNQFKEISLSDILWHVPGIRYHVSLGWAFLMWLLLKVNKEHIIIWLKAAGIFQSSCVINATSWVLSFLGISLCWSLNWIRQLCQLRGGW